MVRVAKATDKHVKWSVTVPAKLARMAEQRVARGDAPSISAIVTRALEHELDPGEDELSRTIRGWIESGEVVITAEDREWVQRALDL